MSYTNIISCYRSLTPALLHHLHSHSLLTLHYLCVKCSADYEVSAIATFLPQCTNLRTLSYERDYGYDVWESVEEEMWEAAVRRCKNLEVVRVGGDDSVLSCDRLVNVMKKLSEIEGIQAQKLRSIVDVDWRIEREEDYAEHFKHLLPALQQ